MTDEIDGKDFTPNIHPMTVTLRLGWDFSPEVGVDREWLETALQDWFVHSGIIRQMESEHLSPAGTAQNLILDEDEVIIQAKIVEPTAIRMIMQLVYSCVGYGVANAKIRRDKDFVNGEIYEGQINCISLMDEGARPDGNTSSITLGKAPRLRKKFPYSVGPNGPL